MLGLYIPLLVTPLELLEGSLESKHYNSFVYIIAYLNNRSVIDKERVVGQFESEDGFLHLFNAAS